MKVLFSFFLLYAPNNKTDLKGGTYGPGVVEGHIH